MRELSQIERSIIERIADRLDEETKAQLLSDLQKAKVNREQGNIIIIFDIDGYQRPQIRGQHLFAMEGRLVDEDGMKIDILLYADPNDRLLELEIIRWDGENIIKLDLDKLEIIDGNSISRVGES